MTKEAEAQRRIEMYLTRLRKSLRGLNPEDIHEVIEELRSHIRDKAALTGELTLISVDSALASLGDPRELAEQYLTDNLLARSKGGRSPLRILAMLSRWASLSVAGFLVLAGALAGYFLAASLMLCGVLKAIHPHTAGIWTTRDSSGDLSISLRLGFGAPPVGGRDVLGWWIVPIGLVLGSGLVILTTKLTLLGVRLFRRKHKSPLDSQLM